MDFAARFEEMEVLLHGYNIYIYIYIYIYNTSPVRGVHIILSYIIHTIKIKKKYIKIEKKIL